MSKADIKTVLELLKRQYGSRQLEPHHDPLAELVLTILSQNTSDINSRPAFAALKQAFNNWDDMADADVDTIEGIIRGGGLGWIKARRIKESLREIKRQRGDLDLGFLAEIPFPEARGWLKRLPGVGNKTANCVLLFALGKPALPVDTHIYRVTRRLGLIEGKSSLEDAHRILEQIVPAEKIYEFHVLTIEHGRNTCIARRPHCPACILKEICPSVSITPVPA
ncbi:MAG: endonuclease III [Dehalococcoidales bacterium]|nr:endonuclease III [Dehalococcoidales bacterium]